MQFTQFINLQQLAILKDTSNEENEYFKAILDNIVHIINNMPVTYETDELGKNAIAQLHYFTGNMDWYVVERDVNDKQLQACGWIKTQDGTEAGYINIVELLENNVELDFYFEPKPIKELI